MKCIILSARRYDFEDATSKKHVQGVTVNYIEGKPLQEADERGSFPLKITGTPETWGKLAVLPGVYECDFRQRPGKDNRPTLTLTDVHFVSPLGMDGIVAEA